MDKAFCQPSVVTRSSFIQYLRCFSPDNKATSKWCRYGVFKISGPTVAMESPKSGYSSAEASYYDFELLFLVVSATLVEIESHKCFVQHSMEQLNIKTTKTVVTDFIFRKDHLPSAHA